MITEIIFIIGGKITLSLNIVPSDLIERKCVTKVFDIGADRPVIRLYLSECKCIYNASGRGEVGNIIAQKIAKLLHQWHITNTVFFLDIPHDQGIKYIRDIVVSCIL